MNNPIRLENLLIYNLQMSLIDVYQCRSELYSSRETVNSIKKKKVTNKRRGGIDS